VAPRSTDVTSVALLIRVEPSRACNRPATSRASWLEENKISSGAYVSTSSFSTIAAGRASRSANIGSSFT
jgi:hypothetical protein